MASCWIASHIPPPTKGGGVQGHVQRAMCKLGYHGVIFDVVVTIAPLAVTAVQSQLLHYCIVVRLHLGSDHHGGYHGS